MKTKTKRNPSLRIQQRQNNNHQSQQKDEWRMTIDKQNLTNQRAHPTKNNWLHNADDISQPTIPDAELTPTNDRHRMMNDPFRIRNQPTKWLTIADQRYWRSQTTDHRRRTIHDWRPTIFDVATTATTLLWTSGCGGGRGCGNGQRRRKRRWR